VRLNLRWNLHLNLRLNRLHGRMRARLEVGDFSRPFFTPAHRRAWQTGRIVSPWRCM
jgi:hypothetical protein